jgi:hypothetical protein
MDKPRLIVGISGTKGIIIEVADVLYRMRCRRYFEAEILPRVRTSRPPASGIVRSRRAGMDSR